MNAPQRRFLLALIAVYIAKQIATVVIFPPFTGHDEVAHFEYVRVLATEGRVPTLYSHSLPDDLSQYRPYSIGWKPGAPAPLYTALHPPLYYALMVPVYRAVASEIPETIQYALRAAAIPFGVAVVLLAYLLTTALFPRDDFLAVTVPAVVAFQPQVSYEAAIVNNDMVGIALFSWLLYLLVLTLRDGLSTRRSIAIGCLAGLALLAKGTTIISLALIAGTFWFSRDGGSRFAAARNIAVAWIVAGIFAGPWWWFMVRTYGDPMAVAALAAAQPGLTHHEPFLSLLFSGAFAVERWIETWGEFGWKFIHVSPALVAGLGAVMLAALVGLVTYAAPAARAELEGWQGRALLLLAAACVLSYAAVVQFGTTFILTQARYYFPAVNAAALLVMLGLRAWIPTERQPLAQGVVVLGAIAVNVTIYTAYVIPYWYFAS